MKVAIVHYWLVGMRGAERVLETLCRIYPQADIYTHVVAPERLSPFLRQRTIKTTFIQRLPGSVRQYKKFLPFMPLALEQLDLRGYDLVISSESGPAKGVLTGAETPHLCYCHSPMRYLWDFYQTYLEDTRSSVTRLLMRPFFHYLRLWDFASAARVDRFLANSHAVARRIRKHWRREAAVLHPPVDTRRFSPSGSKGDYYLCLGEFVGYKRMDVAVRACSQSGRRLVVAGDGERRKELEAVAGPSVTFLGRVDDAALPSLYAECKALLFPGEEDFGVVPLEAMCSGRPVVAYARGGALETVEEGISGLFFHEQTPESLNAALDRLEQGEFAFAPDAISAWARQFGEERFSVAFKNEVDSLLAEFGTGPQPQKTKGQLHLLRRGDETQG